MWLQVAVNRAPAVIDEAIRDTGIYLPGTIEWISPLEGDDFAEYQDSCFLDQLRIRLEQRPLPEFWPERGPQWDGLARSDDRMLLIEAKAYVRELNSNPTGATGDSLSKIEASLAETRMFLKVKSETDWSRCFYQYANRLAHLYLLRELNGLDAYLVFVYFVGDHTRGMPVSQADWEAAVTLATTHLGLPKSDWISRYVKDAYIDTTPMRHIEWPPQSTPGTPLD